MALTKRAMKLKSETEASAGGAATEDTETEFDVDDAHAETLGRLLRANPDQSHHHHQSHSGHPRMHHLNLQTILISSHVDAHLAFA